MIQIDGPQCEEQAKKAQPITFKDPAERTTNAVHV